MQHRTALFATVLLLMACGSAGTDPAKDSEAPTPGADAAPNAALRSYANALQGTWTFDRFHLAQRSSMNMLDAQHWMGQQVAIDEAVAFSFANIPGFRDRFPGPQICGLANTTEPLVEDGTNFLGALGFRDLPGLTDGQVRLFRTSCQRHPFTRLCLANNGELFIVWEGALLIMKKEPGAPPA